TKLCGLLNLAYYWLQELSAHLHEDFAIRRLDVDGRRLDAEQILGRLLRPPLFFFFPDILFFLVEVVEELFGAVAERAQEHGRRELAAAVDADVQDVLVVELEV